VTALVERRAIRVADDAANLHATELALDLAHLAIDSVVRFLELSFGGAAAEQATGAMIHRKTRGGGARLSEQDGSARIHRSGDQARMARLLPDRSLEIRMTRWKGSRRALTVHEATLAGAVGQHERLFLHQVVRDLVVHFG
jgi:hypothetical protein